MNKLTILVLVRDRQYNIPKILRYYKNLPCPKIIYDTSISKYDNIANIKKHNFKYFYSNPTPYYITLHNAIQNVNTEYVIDNCDDDITLIEAIEQCYNFLTSNKNYSACIGENAWYINGKLESKHTGYQHAIKDRNLESDDIINRLNTFATTYYSIYHGMIKTKVTKTYARTICHHEPLNGANFQDRLHYIMCCIFGKIKVLKIPYQIRSTENRLIERKEISIECKEHIRFNENINVPTLQPIIDILKQYNVTKEQLFKILNKHFEIQTSYRCYDLITFTQEHTKIFEEISR